MNVKKLKTEALLDIYQTYKATYWEKWPFISPSEILTNYQIKKELDKRLNVKGADII